jgi:hypothetical protein
MALRIEYETHYGLTCEYAHCVVVNVRCSRDIKRSTVDGEEVETKTYPVEYNGKIYANASAYEDGASPIGGFNGRFELNQAGSKQQYNIVKQSYLHLKEQEGFADGVDC